MLRSKWCHVAFEDETIKAQPLGAKAPHNTRWETVAEFIYFAPNLTVLCCNAPVQPYTCRPAAVSRNANQVNT